MVKETMDFKAKSADHRKCGINGCDGELRVVNTKDEYQRQTSDNASNDLMLSNEYFIRNAIFSCDFCANYIYGYPTSKHYHCSNDRSEVHKQGYDVCVHCISKDRVKKDLVQIRCAYCYVRFNVYKDTKGDRELCDLCVYYKKSIELTKEIERTKRIKRKILKVKYDILYFNVYTSVITIYW